MEDFQRILDFWLHKVGPSGWFKKDPQLDNTIKKEFGSLHTKAANHELDAWKQHPETCLALVILLDQFSRNMFRGSAQAFAQDALVCVIAKEAIDAGYDTQVQSGKNFFYLPLMHSETLEDQQLCVAIFTKLAEEDPEYKGGLKYAIQHMEIVKRFGRFPHRNETLGRASTPEEIEFLKGPNSSF